MQRNLGTLLNGRLRGTKARAVVGAVAAVSILGGATAVNALSASGSQRVSQATTTGAAEIGDFFAASLAIGDFNNDGYGDVIAGAPFEDFGAEPDVGVVHVIYGDADGLGNAGDRTIHQGTSGVPGASEADDRFGSAVATGDFDNDGYDDAVVGIAGEDSGERTDAGGFTILYGHRNGLRGNGAKTFTAATSGVRGPAEPFAALGSAVTTGDYNGDGYDDIAVGAPGAGSGDRSGSGAVHILYGSDRGIRAAGDHRITAATPGVAGAREAEDAFASSLASGDFDGDGRDDLAVGIPTERHHSSDGAGSVQVFRGSNSGIVASSGVIVTQASGDLADRVEMDDLFGTSLAAGDFDGDGRDDLAIGSPGEAVMDRTHSGRVHVLYGSGSGLRVTGSDSFSQRTNGIEGSPEAGDEFGWTVAAGDFNNNGRVDLAIGVPGEGIGSTNGAGIVHVLFGSGSGVRGSLHQWYRPGNEGIPGTATANAGFSRALAAGDIDGDGRADLVVGAPGQSVGGDAAAGTLTLILG